MDVTQTTTHTSKTQFNCPVQFDHQIQYGVATPLSTNSTILSFDDIRCKNVVPINSATPITITLPSALLRQGVALVLINTGAGLATVQTALGNSFSTGSSSTVLSQNDTLSIISYGSIWYFI
jgi:hypothetical protein